jgi:hypothetical protein
MLKETAVKPPIIIAEDWDVSIHPDTKHAESFLEPVDVKDGIYTGFDSDGYLLDISIILGEVQHKLLFFKWSSRAEVIQIKHHNPLENREEDLRQVLLKNLGREIKSDAGNQMSISELICLVGKRMPWRLDI